MTEPIARVERINNSTFDLMLRGSANVLDTWKDPCKLFEKAARINAAHSSAVKSLESERDGLRWEIDELKAQLDRAKNFSWSQPFDGNRYKFEEVWKKFVVEVNING